MKNYQWLGGVFLTLVLFTCNNSPENYDSTSLKASSSIPVKFKIKTISRQFGGCVGAGSPCARVRFYLPEANQGGKDVANEINDDLQERYFDGLRDIAPMDFPENISLDSLAGFIAKAYQENIREMGDFVRPWEIEVQSTMLFENNQIGSIDLDYFSDLGNAHGINFKSLINYDLLTGQILELGHIIASQDQLLPLVEEKFRAFHNLNATENLNEAGFFWDKSFSLPKNFALTSEGIFFHYNPYEVAPFSMGSTSFIIPYMEIEDILIRDLGL